MSASDLDRFYDVPDVVTARLHGGPCDGEATSFPAALMESVRPHLVRVVPLKLVLPAAEASGPPERVQRAFYQALRDDFGFFSRDDSGRVRFDFWGLQ
ncbi:hypothetical protein AB0D10_05540 [Kitasatospora sp. NPDC048545]|uniref:hypothetical protein n=1 Tax=Kitasatospora sp. NPDC048545 TaxID=3157208 RepID=UPI0033EC27B0